MKVPRFYVRSIKPRVLLVTLSIFVSSIWLLAFYTSRMLHADMTQLLGEQQFSTASFIAADINEELSQRLVALERAATQISPALMKNPLLAQAFLERQQVLQFLFNGGVFITGMDGTAIADVPLSNGRIGTNYIDRESVIGRPAMGKKLKAPIFSIVVPILHPQGQVIGAMVATINLGLPNFLDKLTQGKFGSTGGFLLVAPQYRLVVTATNKARIMEMLPAASVIPAMDRMLWGFEGTDIFVNARGSEVMNSARIIPIAGWRVVVTTPTTEAFAPVRAMQRHVLLASLLLTLLAGGLTWWKLRRQMGPALTAIQNLVIQANADQPPQALAITRQDEIGDLIAGFNALLQKLGQREHDLRASEQRYRYLIQHNNAIILEIDPGSGQILDANAAASRFYGWSHAELCGKAIQSINTLDRQTVAKEMQAAMAEQRNYFVFPHRLANGELRTVEVHSTPIDDGHHKTLVSIIHDITARKLVEAALQDSEFRWKFAIEGSGDGLWDWDVPHGTVFFSRHWKEMLGFADAEIGLRLEEWSKRVHPDDLASVMAQMQAHLDGTTPAYVCEHRIRCNDGSWKWILDRGVVVNRDADGKPLRMIGTHSDISERKLMEEQVRRLAFYDGLTQLPNRRLLGDRLKQSMAANKRSGCFGAVMFLDLDNFKPLNDLHGHDAGDLLLIEVAKRLRASVRDMDNAARLAAMSLS